MKMSIDINDNIKKRFDKYTENVNVTLTGVVNMLLDDFLRSKQK